MRLFCFPLLRGHLDKCYLSFKSEHSKDSSFIAPLEIHFFLVSCTSSYHNADIKMTVKAEKILELIPEKNFINLPSTCPQYKDHKYILANTISSFPLATQTMLWELLDRSQATRGTSQDLTGRFFWPTHSKIIRDSQGSLKITDGSKYFLNALSNLLVFPTQGSRKDLKLIQLWEALNFPHHSSWCHVSRMKMFNLLNAAVTIQSTTNQLLFPGWLVEELQTAVSAQLFLQTSSDFMLFVTPPSNL